METVLSTSETSVNLHETARRNIPEDCHFHVQSRPVTARYFLYWNTIPSFTWRNWGKPRKEKTLRKGARESYHIISVRFIYLGAILLPPDDHIVLFLSENVMQAGEDTIRDLTDIDITLETVSLATAFSQLQL
jgi:hypothetical protein